MVTGAMPGANFKGDGAITCNLIELTFVTWTA
jgi:hypothetical protein